MLLKKLFIILGAIALLLVSAALCLYIYIQQGLYLPSTTDAELLESYFPPDYPGYSDLKIISSEGEGFRRIPRTIKFTVQVESYPQAVPCQGEVNFAAGDPMMLNVTWNTLQCAGQHRYMELAQIALQTGFTYQKCHNQKIALLLARWVKSGLLSLDDVIFPEVKDQVSALVDNPDLLTRQPALDAGLFDTSQIILRQNVKGTDGNPRDQSIILRCNGRVELFNINPGLIHGYTEIPVGDYLFPLTLQPFSFP